MMSSFSTMLFAASAMVLLLPVSARSEDVTVTLDTGGNFVVDDNQSIERLRVEDSTGTVHIGNAQIGSIGGASNQGDVYYHNGVVVTALPPGTAGEVLQSSGPAANPVWAPAPTNGTQTYYYGISGTSFRPFSDTQLHQTSNFGFWTSIGTTAATVEVIAPVHLPEGATVTTLDCYYYDNSASVSMDSEYKFGRRSWGGNPASLITVLAVTSGALNAIQVVSEPNTGNPVINNGTYQYWLYNSMERTEGTAFDGNNRSYGCRIQYEVDELSLP